MSGIPKRYPDALPCASIEKNLLIEYRMLILAKGLKDFINRWLM